MKSDLKCERVAPHLKAFVDKELPLWTRLQVRAHLTKCGRCREELNWMQHLTEELQTGETEPLDADLRAKILDGAPAPKPEINLRRRTVARRKVGLALAGASVLGVVALSSMGNRVSNSFSSASTKSDSMDEVWMTANREGENARAQVPAAAPPEAALAPRAGAASSQTFARYRDNSNVEKKMALKIQREPTSLAARDELSSNSAGAASSSGYGRDAYIANGLIPQQRAVHKEGSLSVFVDNAEQSGDATEDIIKNLGGFVATNSLSTGAGERRTATLDCRIPVEKFEEAVKKIAALGTVRAKSINGEDITARLAQAGAKRQTLSRELSIGQAQLRLKEKSTKKRDAQSLYYARLEVRQLRVQAAQARAQFETLRRFSDLATLYVSVSDKPKTAAVAGWTGDFGRTSANAWSSFLGAAKLPIQLLIWILAYAPLWIPALIVWRKWGRKWVTE